MRIFFSVGRRAYAAGFAGLLVLLMFFSGQGVGRGAPAAGAPSKNLRYVFAHRYLPALLHEEPQLGLSLALAKQKQELLLKMWDLCRERYPDIPSEQPTGLSVVGERVEDGVVVAAQQDTTWAQVLDGRSVEEAAEVLATVEPDGESGPLRGTTQEQLRAIGVDLG